MKTLSSVGLYSALTIPTTEPSRATSGPPEFPGLTAASNWIRSVKTRFDSGDLYDLCNPDITPEVSVIPIPNGLPTATTSSPIMKARCVSKRGGLKVVRNLIGMEHRHIILGLLHNDAGRRLAGIRKDNLYQLRTLNNMQSSQNVASSSITTPVPSDSCGLPFASGTLALIVTTDGAIDAYTRDSMTVLSCCCQSPRHRSVDVFLSQPLRRRFILSYPTIMPNTMSMPANTKKRTRCRTKNPETL